MSQYLHIADAATAEDLLELGMRTVQPLVELCGDKPPGLLVDHDLFGFDHSPYYDPEKDGESTYFPSRGEVMADLDRLIACLEAAPSATPVGARLPAQHLEAFRNLKAKIESRPEARITSYVWF